MNLLVTGLNHNTAPVEVREELAFDTDAIHPTLRRLDRRDLIDQGVLLSTCNRTELYMLPGSNLQDPAGAVRELCEINDAPFEEINPYLFEHENLRAVEHCFEVAGSLNSMVIGESQILGQVKTAYDIAREGGFCGKFLHQLFQESFRVAKEIRTQTNINRLPTSVGSCAVALATQIFNDLREKNVLVIGSGKMARLCLEHLRDEGVASIDVANRTLERARDLAGQFDGSAHPLDRLGELLADTDIVISSTGSREPILGQQTLREVLPERGTQPLFIIDIAVPRDVADDVRQLDNVYLYDIDNLEDIGQRNLDYRRQEVNRAEELIQQGVQKFDDWIKTQDMGPMIKELKQDVYKLVEKELRQHLDTDHPSIQKSDLQLAAHRITNKLLDDPVNVIKEKAIEEDHDSLNTVQEMFNLDAQP